MFFFNEIAFFLDENECEKVFIIRFFQKVPVLVVSLFTFSFFM